MFTIYDFTYLNKKPIPVSFGGSAGIGLGGLASLVYKEVVLSFIMNVYVEQGNGLTTDYKITFSGTSYTAWLGSNPVNATKINHTDNFSYNYVGTSATISWPPGIGFTGGGSSASVTYPELSNAWRYDHKYSGIVGKAYAITSAIRSNVATYLFGTSTITIGTNDSELVW